MKTFAKIAVLSAAMMAAGAASAASVSGSTNFRVTMPEVLVLYHWDDAHLTLTADNGTISGVNVTDSTALTSTTKTMSDATFTSAAAPFVKSDSIDITLENAWAVRSISSGSVNLALTNPNATLKNVNDNTVTMTTSAAVLTTTATGATNSGTATVGLPSKWTPTLGNIEFTLDLSQATKAGDYASANDTFLLTLTGN